MKKEIELKEFANNNKVSIEKAKKWAEDGLLPISSKKGDMIYLIYGARKIYYSKSKTANGILASIVYASNKRMHVVPESFGKNCLNQEEFDSYIDELVEAKCLKRRKIGGLTYYDAGINANKRIETPYSACLKAVEVAVPVAITVATTVL